MTRLNWKRVIPLLVVVYFLGRYLFSSLWVTEESRILEVVTDARDAVQDKSLFKFQSVLSSDYKDASGLDRSTMTRLATAYFRSQDSVSILILGSDVQIEGEDEDQAVVDLTLQVIGQSGGSISRGLTDNSLMGEGYTIRLRKERTGWKIMAVDPQKGKWPTRF